MGGIRARILDTLGRGFSGVSKGSLHGLAVATFPAEELSYFDRSLTLNGLHEMAVNGSTGAAFTNIWDGTGALDVGSGGVGAGWNLVTTGTPSVEDPLAMHAGTNGLLVNPTQDASAYFLAGAPFDLNGFTTLSLWINTVAWSGNAYVRFEWLDAAGTRQGQRLFLQNYTTIQQGQWQLLTIPVADFAAAGLVDRLRVRFKRAQTQYVDQIQLNSASGVALGPQTYSVCASAGERLEVDRILLTLAADLGGWLHGDFAHINGGLPAGLLLRTVDTLTGDTTFIANLRDNMDLYSRFEGINSVEFMTVGRIVTFALDFKHPLCLRATRRLECVVRDDLGALMRLQARVSGGSRAYKSNAYTAADEARGK